MDAEHGGSLAHEQRPQPLAAVERAVAHGRNEAFGRDVGAVEHRGGEETVELALDVGRIVAEFGFEIVHLGPNPRSGAAAGRPGLLTNCSGPGKTSRWANAISAPMAKGRRAKGKRSILGRLLRAVWI